MAERASNGTPRTLVGRIARWPMLALVAFAGSLIVTVLIEWIGLTFVWHEEGSRRSARVLAQDLAWLSSHGSGPVFGLPAPSAAAIGIAERLHYWCFRWTGIETILKWLMQSGYFIEYLRAALNASQTFFVRLAITLTAIPLFALFAYVGVVEGMVKRDLRRFGGDIEHGMVYHWAKHIAGAVIFIPVIGYLAWPGSVNPAWLFIPFALALGINMMVVSSNFTKYV